MKLLKQRIGPAKAGGASRAGPKRPGEGPEELYKNEIYERAQALDIPGRSKMGKSELVKAIRHR